MGNFAETHPELAAEWHPNLNGDLKPEDFTAGSSSKLLYWCCARGHSWQAPIFSRSKGSGCPFCSNNRVLVGFNDLASQNPRVAAEWDNDLNKLKPSEVVLKSARRAWWLCSKGHSWDAQISSRTTQGTGCPYCAGVKILAGFNDLQTTNPSYLGEWNYKLNSIRPNEIGPSVRKKVWWTCPKGHDYECTLTNKSQGYGCPFCSSKKILVGFNDFASQHPKFANLWDEKKNGIPASQAHKSSPKPAWFKCREGHSFKSSTNTIVGRKTDSGGCPICSGKELLTGFNDLKTRSKDVAKMWHPTKNGSLSPKDVTKSSTKKVWWLCSDNSKHEWQSSVASRTGVASRSKGNGCPVCTSRIVISGVNDLFSVAPHLKSEWHPSKNEGLNPKELTAETPKKAWWLCGKDKRHEWQAQIDTRSKRGLGCPICSNKKTVGGLNDLGTTHPYLAAEFNENRNKISANQVNAGSHNNYWWTCGTCKAEWRAQIGNRSRVNSGCPRCAASGYDATSEGYLYLLRKEVEGLQQFGITNVPKRRTKTHKQNGWELLDVLGPADGYWIISVESALKKFFRAKGLLLPKDYLDKFDGFTESWDSSELKFSNLPQLLEALRRFEDEE